MTFATQISPLREPERAGGELIVSSTSSSTTRCGRVDEFGLGFGRGVRGEGGFAFVFFG